MEVKDIAYTEFGKQAKKKLADRKMTMVQLAAELNISCAYLSDIFTGARKGNPQRKKIVKILGIEEDEKTG